MSLNSKTKFLTKGFTMVELLLYMALLTIFLTVLTSIFTSSIDIQLESEATSSVEQDSRYLLAKLQHDIQQAQSISTPAVLGQSSNSLVLNINGSSYTYSVNGNGNLQVVDPNGTNVLNGHSSTISNFQVQRIGNPGGVEDTLRISFTITSRVQQTKGPQTLDFQTTIALRRQ